MKCQTGTAPGTGSAARSAALATQLLGVVLPHRGQARPSRGPHRIDAEPLGDGHDADRPGRRRRRRSDPGPLEALGYRRQGRWAHGHPGPVGPAPDDGGQAAGLGAGPVGGPALGVRTPCRRRRRPPVDAGPRAERRPTRGGQVERRACPTAVVRPHRGAEGRWPAASRLVGAELVAAGADARPDDGARASWRPDPAWRGDGGLDHAGLEAPPAGVGRRPTTPSARPQAPRGRSRRSARRGRRRRAAVTSGVGLGAGERRRGRRRARPRPRAPWTWRSQAHGRSTTTARRRRARRRRPGRRRRGRPRRASVARR